MIKISLQISLVLLLSLCAPALFATDIEKLSDDDWLEIKSANFTVITDLSEEKARHLIEDLEAYRYFSIELTSLDIIPNLAPLTIFAISSNSNFNKLDLPENWAGVFSLDNFGYSAIANVNGYSNTMKSSNFGRQVLFHEYNHFLVRFTENAKHYPMWYDEGMAEYWGTFKFDGEKVYVGDFGSIAFRAYDLMNMGGGIILDSEKLFKTKELPMTSEKNKDQSAVGRFYAQAFFMIHYLYSSNELRAQLNNYIKYLNWGYSEDAAVQKAFQVSYVELDKAAKKYLNSSLKMRVMSMKEGKIAFPKPEYTLNKLNQVSFYAHIAALLPNYSIFKRETQQQVIEKAIALNPGNTNLKAIQLAQGLAKDQSALLAELEKSASNNHLVLGYKADNLRYNANLLRVAGIPNWQDTMKQARSFYRRSIKADSVHPNAYNGLGDVYNFLPTSEPYAEGLAGFDTASLYNRDAQSFANVADFQIRYDKGIEAILALRNTLAFDKKGQQTQYGIILDNLELLKDVSLMEAATLADGLHYVNDTIYKGNLANGKPSGTGKITRANGSYYEGNFVEGLMQGQGKLVSTSGYTYEGEFQKGIAKGKGTLTYPKDAGNISYVGDIYYLMAFGKGIMQTKQGKYEGEYWYSFRHGQGTYTGNDGKLKLQGRWIYSGYEWPTVGDEQFIGGVNDAGQRSGFGVCLRKATKLMDWCSYKDGALEVKTEEKSKEKAE